MVTRTLRTPRSPGLPVADRPIVPAPAPPPAPPTVRRLVGEQALVVAGQALSGLGNLAFLLVALRWLPAAPFAELATFLALYLLVQLPASALSAGSSLLGGSPTRRIGVRPGVALGVAVLAAAPFLAPVLHLRVGLLALLAASLPAAPSLALLRGRLYGQSRTAAVAATLVSEPLIRLSAGLLLLRVYGVVGGATGVVAGGYVALAVAWLAGRRRAVAGTRQAQVQARTPAQTPSPARLPWLAVAGFLGFAVVQNQDLVLANSLLPTSAAGAFAALSTLGGIAAFATANVPLVLLPRAGRDAGRARHATIVALVFAVGIGAVLVLAAALAPVSVLTGIVGDRYAGIAGLAAAYVGAMGLLGVARVIGARLVAAGRGRVVAVVVAVTAGVQATAIVLAPRTVRGVALSTLLAVAVLTAGLAAAAVRSRAASVERASLIERVSWRTVALVGSIGAAGVAARLLITRGLWVDEAISVTQARMSFGDMLHNLRTTDVHPPGYFAMLWGWVRVFGDGPLAVRMPSILIGLALVLVLYAMGRDLYGRRTGLIAATFGAVAPQLVWYSQEARMYGLFMLLVTLSVWAQLRALRSGSTKAWLAHGLLSAAMLWTQYFTVLVVVTQQVATLAVLGARLRRREPVRRSLLGWLAALVLIVALTVPLLPFAYDQFSVNQAAGRGFGSPQTTARQVTQPGGSTLSPYVVLANLLWAVWGYHSTTAMTALGALWPAGMLLALVLLGRGRSRTTQVALAVAVVPIVGMYVVGTEKRFLFDLRYFIGCVPLFLLVAARAVATWPRTRVGSGLLALGITATLLVGLGDQQINGDNPRRYDFEPALSRIAATATTRDQVVLAPEYLSSLASYYQPQLRTVREERDPAETAAHTTGDDRVFVLGSFFDVGGERQRIAALLHRLERDRELVATWRLSNVKVWEFR